MPLTTDEVIEIAKAAWVKVCRIDATVCGYDTYAFKQEFLDELRRRLQRREGGKDAKS